MSKEYFNFDLEFRLGIDSIDSEHMKLVDMLNQVNALLSEGKKNDALVYFNQTLSDYVYEHFTNEEKFMESIGYPALDDHKKIHAEFRRAFQELAPAVEAYDETAFQKSLEDTYEWIINHIGKMDKKYVTYFASRK